MTTVKLRQRWRSFSVFMSSTRRTLHTAQQPSSQKGLAMPTEATEISEATETATEVTAQHGQKMIEVTLRFWTDGLASDRDSVIPKNCTSSGVARVSPNPTHGIGSFRPVPFTGLSQIVSTIEELFVDHGIKVHPDRRTRRYLAD